MANRTFTEDSRNNEVFRYAHVNARSLPRTRARRGETGREEQRERKGKGNAPFNFQGAKIDWPTARLRRGRRRRLYDSLKYHFLCSAANYPGKAEKNISATIQARVHRARPRFVPLPSLPLSLSLSFSRGSQNRYWNFMLLPLKFHLWALSNLLREKERMEGERARLSRDWTGRDNNTFIRLRN